MSFQAYLANIQTKTGKSPDEFRALAQKRVSRATVCLRQALKPERS